LLDVIHRLDPDKKAVYVFYNTGLEYEATKRHLVDLEEKYNIKIEWVDPILPIPTCCRKYGVPFWSKRVSDYIQRLQRHGFKWEDRPFDELYAEYPKCKAALRWWCNDWGKKESGAESSFNIAYTPWLKEYMVSNPPPFSISAKCCEKAKKGPANLYEATHDFDMNCTGVRKAEGGARSTAYKTCFTQTMAGADAFRPLFWLTDKDKQDYKDCFGVVNSDCYEVWGMKRTGCCGCPFGKNFEQELDLIQQHEPKFYKAAVKVFGESYEYTRNFLRFREEMKAACQGADNNAT
jgi:3'-phosphoadenosine 5'-phosphosulfate sulfotransferase (PAPS reductase)/FAD synthetase